MARNPKANRKRKQEEEILVVSSSVSDSQSEGNEDQIKSEASSEQVQEEEDAEEVEETEEEVVEAKRIKVTSPRSESKKANSKKKEKEIDKRNEATSSGRSNSKKGETKKKEKIDDKEKNKSKKVEQKEEIGDKKKKKPKKVEQKDDEKSALCSFPMNRVSRIIRSENSDIRMFSEAVFLINKAAEMFLELFSMEAYACTSQDRKKKVDYKHLSSVIPKRRRFDFLSDFIPEKVKVEDALKEIPLVET